MNPAKGIIFDSRFLSGKHSSGIVRDSKALLEELENFDCSITLLNYKNGLNINGINKRNPVLNVRDSLTRATLKSICLGINIRIPKAEDSLLFLSQISPIQITSDGKMLKRLIRVHDLFPLTNPEWFTKKAQAHFQAGINSITSSDMLIANSWSTSQKLLDVLNRRVSSDQVKKVSCSIPSFETSIACEKCDVCSQQIPEESFILAVGTIEPRKNYIRLALAWNLSALKREGFRLYIVGRPGWKNKSILKTMKTTEGITHLQNLCDFQLNLLYQRAYAFTSVSLDEGFNIPVHEAVRYGKKLILSDIPVHREYISKESALWIDPSSPESIQIGLDSMLFNNTKYTFAKFKDRFSNEFENFASEVLKIKRNIK